MNNIDNSLFFNSLTESSDTRIMKLTEEIKLFIENNNTQVYLLDKILGVKNKLNYDIKDVVYVAIPNYPILLIFDDDYREEQIKDHLDDLKEDIGQLSVKYEYNYILDRPRKWNEEWFQFYSWNNFDFKNFIQNNKIKKLDDKRKIELLISLITGSINDIEKIGKDLPETLLDKVKKQIMLLDGKQSHFIYDRELKNQIFIQGMAGTGKTELLMRKIKELYVGEENSRIAFTCHNKVLATEMKQRIEKFFNFMKVEEQIDWDNRLKVFHSWGSKYGEKAGMYSYICENYHIPYLNFKEAGTFDNACKYAINSLKELANIESIFDYIFIDESQDFDQSFFELCKLVCKNTVYIAGDIFQSIFDETEESDLKADYMLDKCYRTDPRTLMFAHSIGMGLFEEPPLNWLRDEEWKACGYKVLRESSSFKLTREPLRRFNDVQSVNSIIVQSSCSDELHKMVLDNIKQLKADNCTIKPGDLGIIIICNNYNSMIQFSYKLKYDLLFELEWNSTIGVETKYKESNSVYISNENNVKGLEFPFTISLLLTDVGNSIKLRNSLYMSLTRSFITSYLIMNRDTVNQNFINIYEHASKEIIENGFLNLKEPTGEQIKNMKHKITMQKSDNQTILQQVENLLKLKKYSKLSKEQRDFIFTQVKSEWFLLSSNDILNKVKSIADNLI
ncbi:DEAD/DEAH box helicase [Peptoniphilus genitalis]|uniref:DEAD/DEAH box helicase n=1 Tax=Peptoniphilus genitalis TaxID=3036303 RepID=UPI0024AC9A41|nr:UvrD-helicase domain-containing protein [Peptoniphilus sp. Marseille-Q7072]